MKKKEEVKVTAKSEAKTAMETVKSAVENTKVDTIGGEADGSHTAGKEGTTKAADSAKAEPKSKTEEKSNVAYMGPSIPFVVQKGTVFQDGALPEGLSAVVERVPAMSRLIVPVEEMPEMAKQLSDKDSAASAIFAAVAKSI